MSQAAMSSMQRTLTALGHAEPDRVPLFLLTNLHGARETGRSIEDYYADDRHVTLGQLRLLQKYQADCLYAFYYASIEIEAWGGSTLFSSDGPPLCGAPVIGRAADIDTLRTPDVAASPSLQKVLRTIAALKAEVGGEVPIIGVAISPFSLPVMQMGFHAYLDLMADDRPRLDALLHLNEAFTVAWANAQLAAGATAICYFDPVSSPTNVPRSVYLDIGQAVARRTLSQIHGPTATHLASGRALPIIGDVADTGTAIIGVSALEDLVQLKRAAAGRLSLLGNLNGIEMRRWTPAQAEAEVRRAIAKAGRGGGFLLGDNHGEIPWQVGDEVLLAIGEAARRWGRYPLDWIDDSGDSP